MRRINSRATALATLAVITSLTAACGGSSRATPTSPSAPLADGGAAAAGATISGTVQGAGPSSLTSATTSHAVTGLSVAVVGTSLGTTVDAAGRFTLTGVPPGDVQLRFTGSGIDAVVPVGTVQPAQTVSIVVTLSGNSGRVETETKDGQGEQELEGRVEALPPTVAAGSLRVAGRLVTTDGNTRIVLGGVTKTFAALEIGQRVHVRGKASGSDLLASLIDIQNTNTAIPVEVNGVIDTLTGGASAFQFKIGSRVVKGDATTDFFGDGNQAAGFGALVNGVRVEVKGEQRDGFIFANRIHVNKPESDDDNGDDEGEDDHDNGGGNGGGSSGGHDDRGQTEIEASGAIGGLRGSCPALSFALSSYQVTTNGSTKFQGSECSTFRNGDKVEMSGTKQSDGSVVATKLKKK